MNSVKVRQIDKKVELDTWRIIKFQLLTHCYLHNIKISDADLDCLTLLSILGQDELTSFCTKLHEKGIFQSVQSARNALSKVEKKNLIIKEGKNRKKISITPDLQILTSGNILLDYKFLARATS